MKDTDEISQSSDAPDRALRQYLVEMTHGGPPISTMTMMADWALHLATAPDKQMSIMQKAQDNWVQWANFVAAGCPDDAGARPATPQKAIVVSRTRPGPKLLMSHLRRGFCWLRS